MGLHERILLLGPTGVEKAATAGRLSAFLKESHGHEIRYIDFERDFLEPTSRTYGERSFAGFLSQDVERQSAIWKAAWDKCAACLQSQITILGVHATYVSGMVGLRCPVNFPAVCRDFNPTLVVTLIDDIQSMWRRTEKRALAHAGDIRVRPTLEQLLSARRSEQILGDMFLTHLGSGARHLLFAGGNTLVALANIIVFDAKETYLSFPISAPREMLAKGDGSFISLLNKFHRLALEEMSRDHGRAFITPLAIDELPFVMKWQANPTEPVRYSSATDRWCQTDLWGSEEAMASPLLADEFEIPAAQIENAVGIIRTDVGWRDRRLVAQAASLAICCPKDPADDRITRGVSSEIDTATAAQIPCYFWQEPTWDQNKFVEKRFPPPGSMGAGAAEALVRQAESLEALIRAEP